MSSRSRTFTRLLSNLLAFAAAIAFVTSVASAQATGVTVFTGSAKIDGQDAPAGTTVEVRLQSTGELLGSALTGAAGFAANQYRIDIQALPALEGATVVLTIQGKFGPGATAVFAANRVFAQEVTATATAPTATPTAVPTATPTAVPTATPTPIPTAAPTPTATAAPTATATPPATPTSTPAPTATATPAPSGGGCNAPLARTGEIDAGWLLMGLIGPGLYLRRRSRPKD